MKFRWGPRLCRHKVPFCPPLMPAISKFECLIHSHSNYEIWHVSQAWTSAFHIQWHIEESIRERDKGKYSIEILIIWISRIQNTWIYCSTSRAKPECCNNVPSAAINILNKWNSNYKYIYFVSFYLLFTNTQELKYFLCFFKYFLKI